MTNVSHYLEIHYKLPAINHIESEEDAHRSAEILIESGNKRIKQIHVIENRGGARMILSTLKRRAKKETKSIKL